MAEAAVEEVESVHRLSEPQKKYFCYQCTSETVPRLPDFTCSTCHSGFVEEMTESAIEEQRARPRRFSGGDVHNGSQRRSLNTNDPTREARTRLRRWGFDTEFGDLDIEDDDRGVPIHSFINSILMALREDSRDSTGSRASGNDSSHWSADRGRRRSGVSQVYQRLAADIGNLDDIITRLVSQLSSSGPEPASPIQIESLSMKAVDEAIAGEMVQCSICMDRFILGELVTALPCQHYYHNVCIVQWLQLHGTCPVCRQPLPRESSDGDDNAEPSTANGPDSPDHLARIGEAPPAADYPEDVEMDDDVVVNVYDDHSMSCNMEENGDRYDGDQHAEAQLESPPSSVQPIFVHDVENVGMDVERDF